jgi:hypothetical protein
MQAASGAVSHSGTHRSPHPGTNRPLPIRATPPFDRPPLPLLVLGNAVDLRGAGDPRLERPEDGVAPPLFGVRPGLVLEWGIAFEGDLQQGRRGEQGKHR